MKRESLAYRKHARAIWNGIVPDKYTRVAECVTGKRVLEIGSAEGVLSLLLAQTANHVTGIELRPDRHATAEDIKLAWRKRGRRVDNCMLICGDIRERLDLLRDIDTVVAVRSIYYLRHDIESVFRVIAKHANEVVLCGNPNRWPHLKDDAARLGPFNRYASHGGMRELLITNGYAITHEVRTGDPIVVGRRIGGADASDNGEDNAGQ